MLHFFILILFARLKLITHPACHFFIHPSLNELVKPGVNGVVFDTPQQLADHFEVRLPVL